MGAETQELNKRRYEKYAKIRDAKGVNDFQIATKAGVSPSTFTDWKTGRSTPAFGNIVKIADAMGVAVNDFEV